MASSENRASAPRRSTTSLPELVYDAVCPRHGHVTERCCVLMAEIVRRPFLRPAIREAEDVLTRDLALRAVDRLRGI